MLVCILACILPQVTEGQHEVILSKSRKECSVSLARLDDVHTKLKTSNMELKSSLSASRENVGCLTVSLSRLGEQLYSGADIKVYTHSMHIEVRYGFLKGNVHCTFLLEQNHVWCNHM